jgi:hypothetical protein
MRSLEPLIHEAVSTLHVEPRALASTLSFFSLDLLCYELQP